MQEPFLSSEPAFVLAPFLLLAFLGFAFPLFCAVVGWRALKALERIARALERRAELPR